MISKKIILVPKYYLPTIGGLQNFTHRLAKGLIDAKREVFIFTLETDSCRPYPNENEPIVEKLTVQKFSEPRDKFWRNLPARLMEIESTPILAIGLEDVPVIDCQLNALINLQQKGYPAYLRVATTSDIKDRIDQIRATYLKKIAGLIVLNEAMFAEAMALPLEMSFVHLFQNPVDVNAFKPIIPSVKISIRLKYALPINSPIILSAGRLDPRKRLELLIEAISVASSEAVLWIVGDPSVNCDLYMSKLVNLGKRLLPNRIVFTPGLPDHIMPNIYGTANVFAHTSRVEGLSNAILEATSAGLPIVAVAIPGVSEIAKHFRYSGFFLVDDTVKSISNGIKRSLCSYSSRSWRQVREPSLRYFSPGRIANLYLRLLSNNIN